MSVRALRPRLACLAVAILTSLGACSSATQRADLLAEKSGFDKQLLLGARFHHVVYRNTAPAGPVLHVYIEGDGTPFSRRDTIAADPTPRAPLMLRLMAEDSAPSVYLGRPCYFGVRIDPDCGQALWTSRRFAPEVLDSMETVLRGEIERSGAQRVALYGHSGGGTLAVLLAQRVERVTRVVTIGPTLDIAAWCRLHGYSPLLGSVNPVDPPAPRAGVNILHLVGAKDENTPPGFVKAAAVLRGGEAVRVVADFDHNCCWDATWRGFLNASPEP